MEITSEEIAAMVGTFMWPFFRIAAMVMSAPVFGSRTLPYRIKLVISIALSIVIVPLLPVPPAVDVLSPAGIYITAQQVLIGVALGFATQLVFSAVITGGQIIAMQMGLGFSLMIDPQNGSQAPVLSQFYVVLTLLVYVSSGGHLVLINILADSFTTMPISINGLSANSIWEIVIWGANIFVGGVGIAIPAIASLLVVNLAFGVMTRAAPQLNIFAIGFPVTMMLGFALVLLTLSSALPRTNQLFLNIYQVIRGFSLAG